MSENQVKNFSTKKYKKMSFQELGNFINNNLEKQYQIINVDEYNHLIGILESKIKEGLNSGINKDHYIRTFVRKKEKLKSELSVKISTHSKIIGKLYLADEKLKEIENNKSKEIASGEIYVDKLFLEKITLNVKKLKNELIIQKLVTEKKLNALLKSLKSYNYTKKSPYQFSEKQTEHSKIFHILDEIEQSVLEQIREELTEFHSDTESLKSDFNFLNLTLPSQITKRIELNNDNFLNVFFDFESPLTKISKNKRANLLFADEDIILDLIIFPYQVIKHLLPDSKNLISEIEEKRRKEQIRYENYKDMQREDWQKAAEIHFERDENFKLDQPLKKRQEYIVSLRSKKKRVFDNIWQNLRVQNLPWKLIPKGEWTTEELVKTFQGYSWANSEFDEERLRKIITNLAPNICYIGEDNFQGYVVFGFDWTNKVVLECPKYGNAIYIIKGDWQEITKFSKWELRNEYSSQVNVIRHNETWLERLKLNLKNPN